MKVGAYLLEKHNFGDPEVKARFLNQFGYSETILEKILQDVYPVLLGCHIYDIAIFTGEDPDFIHSLEEFDRLSDFQKQTVTPPPMGKPFTTHLDKPIPDDILFKGPTYVTPVEELEQTFSIGNPPKQPGVRIELNLGTDKPIELVGVDEEGIRRYEEATAKLRASMDYPTHNFNHDSDPELDALIERIKDFSKGKSFKVITPKALEPGDTPKKDPGEVDYVITTYPITGIESVKIVKGRELGIGTGDKFVISDQMKTTIGKLGLDNEKPKEVDVLLGNKYIAALMEDPEFRKVVEEANVKKLIALLTGALKDKDINIPPEALDREGINIYTQPSVPGLALPEPSQQTVVHASTRFSTPIKPEADKVAPDPILPEPELPIGISGTITLDMSDVTMGNARTGVETKVVVDKNTVDKFNIYQAVVNDIKDENPINKLKDEELVPVPKSLLRELANIAIDNGYPCADEIFEILSKHK